MQGYEPKMAAVGAADNTNGSFGGFLFHQVPIGEYKIVVAPTDTYPDDDDLFRCYAVVRPASPPRHRGQCTASCVSATTKSFLVPETHAHLTAGFSTSRASVAETDGAVVAVAVSLAVSLWAAAHA